MKKFLLFCFSLLFLKSVSAQTNIYHPFPESGAVWNVHYEIYACQLFPYVHAEKYSYIIDGDTTIGATDYHKLRRPFSQILDSCWGTIPINNSGYMGCFRQDTSLKKVFYIARGTGTEELLYDFNLSIGDTVSGFLVGIPCAPETTTVTGLDSVFMDGNYRKRWEWSNQWGLSYTIVEGIGSLGGLLENTCEIIDGPATALSCFRENNVVLYNNPDYSDSVCDIIDAIKSVAEEKFTLTIAPNPFHNGALLTFDNNRSARDKIQLKIYNTMGTLVREEEIPNITSDSHWDYLLHRDGLHDGLYFYELLTNNFEPVGNGKFVIE